MANDVTNSNGRVTADEVIHKDSVFKYQLLDRLRSDCEYYLNYGNRHPKSLWAGDEKLQIEFMKCKSAGNVSRSHHHLSIFF